MPPLIPAIASSNSYRPASDGKVNERNGWIPRDHWLEEREEKAISDFYRQNPQEGCRRLTYMLLDADIVAVKRQSIRPRWPLSLADARQIVAGYVEHYNTRRLHSALGYITPADKLAGRASDIFAARHRKLEAARQQREAKSQAARPRLATANEKSGWTEQPAPERVGSSRETEAGCADEQPAEG